MGLALVHAGTANEGVKRTICAMLRTILRLRAGRLKKMQRQARESNTETALPFYSTEFIRACGDRSSKVLVEMYMSCLALSAGIVMSGTGLG